MSVNVNDADWQKIQELFAKERQWTTAQMQKHIREVNSMLLMNGRMFMNDTRNMMVATSVTMPCGSLVLWLFFTIGVFVIAGGIGMIIAKSCGK